MLRIEQNSGIGSPTLLKLITLEEHFTTPEFLRATAPFTPAIAKAPALEARLLDLGDQRIAAMDEGGVDLQVLSLAATGQEGLPPADATALVRSLRTARPREQAAAPRQYEADHGSEAAIHPLQETDVSRDA